MSKILPIESQLSAPYWEGARKGVLTLQRCGDCEKFQFYPRILCSHCTSQNLSWEPVSGRGKVLSYTIVRRGISSGYDAPYVIALIDLNEGVTMMSTIQTLEPESIEIGATVDVVFEDWGENIQMPVFKLQEADL